MIDERELTVLRQSLQTLAQGFSSLAPVESQVDGDKLAAVLQDVASRMQDNYPYHHPRYAGQMLKPPHPVARIAYMLSLWINPNNHALDGSRASSPMELEAVDAISRMFGFEQTLGHLCGGGTMANLEALWVAGQRRPGKKIVASEHAHYTHNRISGVLGLQCDSVPMDDKGRMELKALESMLAVGDVGTVVATLGTTGLGAVDPLPEILELRERYDFRVHVDTAYGGYFHVSSLLAASARAAFDHIRLADSVVIDPHKHGLQPYGCGCVLFSDPTVGVLYKHNSGVTYFTSAELHLGEISLECSRPGAAAVALWATQQLLPMTPGGEFAQSLDRCLLAARAMHDRLAGSAHFRPLHAPELDIVVYAAAAASGTASSERTRQIFEQAAAHDLHLAMIEMPSSFVAANWPDLTIDSDTVTCLRSCLMKPEHLDWVEEICDELERLAA